MIQSAAGAATNMTQSHHMKCSTLKKQPTSNANRTAVSKPQLKTHRRQKHNHMNGKKSDDVNTAQW